MGFLDTTLANGLRVVVEPMESATSAAGGFLVRTGSRDETPDQAGVSHFLEHMCFKGTARRTWQDITVGFDDLGSTYNAFTSKERTFYYGWVRRDDLDAQLDLLADMMRSALPPPEFDMEKNVILEEIAMSHDQIESHVYDLIHEKLYAGHPLQWPVLGHKETVAGLSRDGMHGYFSGRYNPANMVLVVAGNVRPDEVLASARRMCDDWPGGAPRPKRQPPATMQPGTTRLVLPQFKQQCICLAYPAPSAVDERDAETSDAVASVLGAANSRFYWQIVQAGVAHAASAWRVEYCDCGLMVLFGFCEPERCDALSDALRREAERITREGVSAEELQRVKNRRRTGLVAEAESPFYRLTQLADDVDTFDRPRDVEERMRRVERISIEEVADHLRRWPITGAGHLFSVGPREWPATAEK